MTIAEDMDIALRRRYNLAEMSENEKAYRKRILESATIDQLTRNFMGCAMQLNGELSMPALPGNWELCAESTVLSNFGELLTRAEKDPSVAQSEHSKPIFEALKKADPDFDDPKALAAAVKGLRLPEKKPEQRPTGKKINFDLIGFEG